MDETKKQQIALDEDKVVFVPIEDIRAIESIISDMEQAQQNFNKVIEGMKPIILDNKEKI